MHVETSQDGIKKRFILLTTCVKTFLRNVYSLDLNYDIELKIHGRVRSGKLEDNRSNTSEVEVGRLVQSVRQQSW